MAENCAFDLLEDRCAWSSMSAKRSPGPGISCQEDRRLAEGLAISLTKDIQTRASGVQRGHLVATSCCAPQQTWPATARGISTTGHPWNFSRCRLYCVLYAAVWLNIYIYTPQIHCNMF